MLFATLISAAAAAGSPGAVVIDSSSPDYARGDAVGAGASLSLRAGESVTVLHRSGAVRTFLGAGAHPIDSPADARASAATSAMAALVATTERPATGATRGRHGGACEAVETADPQAVAASCGRTLAEGDDAPELSLAFSAPISAYSPGAAMRLQASTNFDAFLACEIAPADAGADPATVRLGFDAHGAARLSRNVAIYAPVRGGAPLRAPEAPGRYALSCDAFDETVWKTLARALDEIGTATPPYPEWRRMAARYAEISRSSHAIVSLSFTVSH